ncbi:MAG: T9SS C-terminal target domain-containing protein [Candidatus Kapaibacterium sp.]
MNLRTLALGAAAFVGLGIAANAQIVPGAVALPDSITGNRTLSADTVYQIVNTVKVGPGALLTIQPGTLIYGNSNGVRSCLQIERDGKIYAQGTATAPIIFTSAKPQGQKAPGDWGGVILLGKATINPAGGTATIEGGTNGIYGGTDDADSSGVMSYVRIEFGGLAFSVDNEINGLTFGGIGNRTKIDHIQCSYTNDDSFEWFGGTVNCKNLIAYAGTDDDIDTDFGFRGRLQFIFAMRDATQSDLSASSTSEGFEADNDGTGSLNTPNSRPIVSNATMVGAYDDTNTVITGQDFSRGGRLRRNTHYGIFNTVITGWQAALGVDGNNTANDGNGLDDLIKGAAACPQPADFRVQNTVVTGLKAISEIRGIGGTAQADADNWFNCAGAGNVRAGNHSDAQLTAIRQADLHAPNPVPLATSPAVTNATSFADPLLAPANNFAFTNVSYRGAFDPTISRNNQWDAIWSNYKPQTSTYVKHRSGWNLVGLANTPANASKDSVYRNAASSAFRFGAGYVASPTLTAGSGYFLKLSDNSIVEQKGTTVNLPVTVTVQAGWNLISTGASVPALTDATHVTATGTTRPTSYFGFNNGYANATTLEPGKAYWVKCTAAGTLTFNP